MYKRSRNIILNINKVKHMIIVCRLKNDRKRQEILAKSRLEELQKRKGKQKDNIKDEVVKTGNRAALQV